MLGEMFGQYALSLSKIFMGWNVHKDKQERFFKLSWASLSSFQFPLLYAAKGYHHKGAIATSPRHACLENK